jgi:hypothetical protein
MKKTITALMASILFAFTASSQTTEFGFTGGATISNYKAVADGDDESGNSKAGFTIGAIVNIAAGSNFVIQPGLHWTQKGTKDEETVGGSTYKVSLTNNCIEIPVNFLYTQGGFFAGAGPSLSFSVSGKWKYEFDSDKTTESANFGNTDNDDMKSLDLGANILAGYRAPGGLLIMVNFNQGFSNLVPGETSGSKLKSHYFGVRLGYLLKAKK